MVESDRSRFVDLFTDPDFMVFAGVQTVEAAEARVDHLIALNREIPFAKQPIVVRDTGLVVGYAGVDRFELHGEEELELGYRLVPEARGLGYATEASAALLDVARTSFAGTIFAIIHEGNAASTRTIDKLGFRFWKRDVVYGELRNLYRWRADGRAT